MGEAENADAKEMADAFALVMGESSKIRDRTVFALKMVQSETPCRRGFSACYAHSTFFIQCDAARA